MKKGSRAWILILMFAVVVAAFFYSRTTKNSYLTLLRQGSAGQANQLISTVIVPHHDLVKDQRAEFFSSIKDKASPKTIVLASTNHFNTGSCDIETSDKDWELSNGKIAPNQTAVNKIVEEKLACKESSAFENEHGIKNILSDIHTTFPSADIVPLIMKNGTKTTDLDNLIASLSKQNDNFLFIASVDFSHYQPANLAEIHDSLSLRYLYSLDKDNVAKAETDSPEVLYAAISWAKLKKAEKFNLFANTNSGLLANDFDAETTTHIFGYYDQSTNQPESQELTFTFGGDMMFDRGIEYFFQGNDLMKVMENLGERTFWGTDISIANLEGPISKAPREPDYNHSLVFYFPPKTIDVLQWMHLNAVSLANNHSLNQGQSGLNYTKELLRENNIAPIGQDEKVDSSSIQEFTGEGIKASVITLDTLNTDLDISLIKQEKDKGNKVIIFPHWGIEYEQIHSYSQAQLAHSWIDAGADLIIGSHPHVVQDVEVYKNVPIIYSLGNLLFDQYFSSETQQGIIVAGKFSADKLEMVILPTIQKDSKPQLQTGASKQKITNTILKNIKKSEKIKTEQDKITITY